MIKARVNPVALRAFGLARWSWQTRPSSGERLQSLAQVVALFGTPGALTEWCAQRTKGEEGDDAVLRVLDATSRLFGARKGQRDQVVDLRQVEVAKLLKEWE